MATHSSIIAWRNPWTEEPGGLQTMGSQRVGHDSHFHFHTSDMFAKSYRKVYPWGREWLPTPVFLPGEFPGHRDLPNYSPLVEHD